MGFFEKFEKAVSDVIDDLIGEDAQKCGASEGGGTHGGWNYDDELRAAEEELEEFLRGGGAGSGADRGTKTLVFPAEIKAAFAYLGVAQGAPLADCKKAFRALSKKYHPDQVGQDKGSSEIFLRIKSSYDILEKWHIKNGV